MNQVCDLCYCIVADESAALHAHWHDNINKHIDRLYQIVTVRP